MFLFLSCRLVNKSTCVLHHRVNTNVYVSHIVGFCVVLLVVLMSPMCVPVPDSTCEYVWLKLRGGLDSHLGASDCMLPCYSRCLIHQLVISLSSRRVFMCSHSSCILRTFLEKLYWQKWILNMGFNLSLSNSWRTKKTVKCKLVLTRTDPFPQGQVVHITGSSHRIVYLTDLKYRWSKPERSRTWSA